jgi:ribonuclease-3
MNELQKKINYQFKDIALLRQALTHRSMGKGNNERLEFLGDSVLGVVVSRELYQRFPSIAEGKLSRFKSYVVRGQTLALIAAKLELSNLLILGSGELKSGGHNRKSIQSDAVEAILGAIFLEADFDTVNTVILDLTGTCAFDTCSKTRASSLVHLPTSTSHKIISTSLMLELAALFI